MCREAHVQQEVSPFSCLTRGWKYFVVPRSLLVITFLLISSFLFSQEISIDNARGNWLENAAWEDGSAPDTTAIADDVAIYGFITAWHHIDFISGDLSVYDTLIIYGDLTLGTNANLNIGTGGILIVKGNLTIGSQVVTLNAGQLVVAGQWEMGGTDDEGAFENDGLLYILDADPDLKTGIGYEDFTCLNPADSCQQYDLADLSLSEIWNLYLAGPFSVEVPGTLTFCFGDSLLLSTIDSASNYQWYRDSAALPGATGFEFYASDPGAYYVTFNLGNDSFALAPVVVNGSYCASLGSRGPGGVGDYTSNSLWLKAADISGISDGAKIQTPWMDRSGNAHHASQSTLSDQPVFIAAGINGQPVVSFDGVRSFLDDNHSYNAQTFFSVFQVDPALQDNSQLAQLWGNYADGMHVAPDPRSGNSGGYSFDGVTSSGTRARYAHNGEPYGTYVSNDNYSTWTAGTPVLLAAEFENTDLISRQVIGSLYPAFNIGEHQFGGQIGEMLVYNVSLNSAQRIIVENYLSGCYGIDITASGHDYFSNEVSHPFDIAGIGREDISNYHAEAFSGGILGITAGSGMDADGEYLFFAHDNGRISDWSTGELADTVAGMVRIEREWIVEETGDLGQVDVTIDTTLLPSRPDGYSSYVLLVDSDGDFSSGAQAYEMRSAGNDSLFSVSSLDIATGSFLSIGVVAPRLQFLSGVQSGFETENAEIRVFINFLPAEDITVDFFTTDGTAISPDDYTAAIPGASATIPSRTDGAFITVPVVNNLVAESDRSFSIELAAPSGDIQLGEDSMLVYTIMDDDHPRKIYFSLASSTVDEGTSSHQVSVQITPSEFDEVNTTTVDYAVSGGTAEAPGDYLLASGTLSIPPFSISASFNITIVDDGFNEDNETIKIALSAPQNGSLSSVEPILHTVTLIDNDSNPGVRFSSVGADFSESEGTVSLPVSLAAVSALDVEVEYLVTGSADAADHTLTDGTIMIPAGQLEGAIQFDITDDLTGESSETIIITLQDPPVNATLESPSSAVVTIIDNDSGMGYTGPGGVGDSLINELWLDANDISGLNNGDELTGSWPDRSGNGHDASQSDASYLPLYINPGINGMPAVRFDGISDSDFLDDPHAYDARTVFSVFRVDGSLQAGGELAQLWGNYGEGVHVAADPRSGGNVRGWSFDGDNSMNAAARYALSGDTYGTYVQNDNTVQWTYDQAELLAVEFEVTQSINRQIIGSLFPSFAPGAHQFGGDIAELIVFNSSLNNTQRIIVENYLAAKYSLDISAAGVDYYDYEVSHPFDVAGIGQVSGSDNHLVASSAGILKVSGSTGIGDNEFLLFGHDNGNISNWTTAETPADSLFRLAREWVFDETGETGTINVAVDSSSLGGLPAGTRGLFLLLDADGDFTSGASVLQMQWNNGYFEASTAGIADGTRLSIATLAPVVSFRYAESAAPENAGNASIQIILSESIGTDIQIDFSVTGGTAVPGVGNDYILEGSPVILPAGDTTLFLDLAINDDLLVETEETVLIEITGLSANVAPGTLLDHVFTISDNDNNGFTGPGGVGDSTINTLWLRAEDLELSDGDPVVLWPDTSGNHHDALNLSPGQEPHYYGAQVSGRPVVRFDEDNQEYLGNNLSLGINSSDAATVFIFGRNRATSDDDNTGLFIGQSPGSGGTIRHYGLEYEGAVRFNNGNRIFADGFTLDDWKLGTWSNIAGANYGAYDFFADGVAQAQVSSAGTANIPNTSDNLYFIGAGLSASTSFSTSRFFEGDLAEVIVYHYTLNETERIIVENYLSSRYYSDVSISNDYYGYDAEYGNDVAGIGQVGPADFHTTAQSAGVLRISNATGLGDGDFLLFGHNGFEINSWNITGTPDENVQLLPRIWRLDETGDAGDVVFRIDTTLLPTTPAQFIQYMIWLDDDGDFSEGAVPVNLARNGDVYETSYTGIAGGQFVAIGVLRPVVNFNSTVSSGDESQATAPFTAQLNYPVSHPVMVEYAVSPSVTTATGGGVDFTLNDGVVTIPAGVRSADFNMAVTDDALAETDEVVGIALKNPSAGVSLGDDTLHIYTISDNDNGRKIDFTVAASSSAESAGNVFLTIRLSASDPVNPVHVDYAVTGGNAIRGTDYLLADGTANVPAGQYFVTIPLSIVGDNYNENDETIEITLSNPVNADLGTNRVLIHSILNDDPVPEVGFVHANSNVSEGTTPAMVPVVLSEISGLDITADYTVTGGTATGGGVDYTLADGTVTILAGDSIAYIQIILHDDALIETEETIEIELSNVSVNAVPGGTITHTVTINNNDYTGYSGPGGVGDKQINKLWLRSDTLVTLNGSDVITWGDLSGNDHHAMNLAFGQEPELLLNQINGNPVISFDDNGGTNGDYLGANLSLGISGAGPSTVFMVARNSTAADEDNTGLFIGQSPGTGGTVRHYGIEYNATIRFNNGNRIFNDGYTLGDWKIGMVRNTSGAQYGQYEGYMNGNVLGQASSSGATSVPATSDEFYYLGAGLSANEDFSPDRYFEGELAEVVVYNSALNETQRILVENYFSSNYALPVATDYFTFDPDFSRDVAGIGMINGTDFHVAAQSAGILKISNANDLDPGEFLLFGHDHAPAESWSTVELPGDHMVRIAREWRADLTGDPGAVRIAVDTSRFEGLPDGYSQYLLMVDNDGDFTTGAQLIPVELADGLYSASNIPLSDGDYLTIAAIQPLVDFNVPSGNQSEGIADVSLVLDLNYPVGRDITLDYNVTGGSATGGTDYNLAGGNLQIDAGTTTAEIAFSIVNDFMVESDETIIIQLSNPSYGQLGKDSIHVFTINDNDNPRAVEFLVAADAGDEGTSPVRVDASLSAAHPSRDLKVAYRVTGGTALGSGIDYTLEPDTLVFLAGTNTASIFLPVTDDEIDEFQETIILELVGTGSIYLNLGTLTEFTYTINDNDLPPETQFSETSASGAESFQTVTVSFELSDLSGKDVSFDYGIAGGTASPGTDFSMVPLRLTIPAGSIQRSVQFSIIDDTEEEASETVEMAISGIDNAVAGTQSGYTYTILDDDGLGWTGPGGVANTSQNKVWLNSVYANGLSDGDPVDIWTDLSGNGNDGKQTGTARPVYLDNAADNWNEKPVVRFDYGFSQYLGIDNTTDLNTGGPYDKRTIIVSFRTGTDISSRQVLYEEGGTARGLNIYLDGGQLYVSGWNDVNDDGGATTPWSFTAVTTPVTANTPYFTALQFNFNGITGDVTGWINGDSIGVLPGAGRLFNHGGEIGVGGMNNGSVYHDGPASGYDHYYNGNISELIINNIVYNKAQTVIVNNYLGAKYNVPIAGDYFDHEDEFSWDVFGIGQEDLYNTHSIAQGNGMIRIDNPSSLDNGDYLLVGHDNGDIDTWTASGVPGNDVNFRRIDRVWRADDRTNGIGTVRIALEETKLPAMPFGFNKYVLLVDSDGDFTSGAEVFELSWNASLGMYTVNNVTLSNDRYFTIGLVRPAISFVLPGSGGAEDISPARVVAELNYHNTTPVSFPYDFLAGSATAGIDFIATPGVVTIRAGYPRDTIDLDIVNDPDVESDETIRLVLRDPPLGYVIGDDSIHTYTIYDDDNLRRVQFTSQVASGVESSLSPVVEVHLNMPDPANDTRVAYRVSGGIAENGTDFILSDDTLTIPAGDTLGYIPLAISDDPLNETDEDLIITLSSPDNANLGDTLTFTYTIIDDDSMPTLQFRDIAAEGAESFSPVHLFFELSAVSGQEVVVYYSVTGGTAQNGGIDYTIQQPSFFSITAGTVLDSASFYIFNDIIEESDETIEITIDSVQNAVLGASRLLTYTIFDDDGVGWLGPGGVSDDAGYDIWLKSNAITGYADGDFLGVWEDASTHNNDAIASAGDRPVYFDNALENVNARPVVDFSGGNYFMEIPNADAFNTGGPYTKKTIIVAFRTGADVATRQVIYEQGGGTRGLNIYIESGLVRMGIWNLANDDGGATTPWGYNEITSPIGANETHYAILEYDAVSSSVSGVVDGSQVGSFSGAGYLFAHSGNIGLGGMNNGSYYHDGSAGGNGDYFGGKIIEFLSFNKTLNSAQKTILENYFGTKYNVSIPNDHYDYEVAHGYELFGIGRFSSGNSHIISQGSGLVKIDNPSDADNNEFFFAGHDNGDITSWTSTEGPFDSLLRVGREWKVGKNGSIGAVRLGLDTTRVAALPPYYDYYILLVDTDGDNDFTTGNIEMIPLTERFGSLARLSNLMLDEGDVFTFAVGRNITVRSGDWHDPGTWLMGVPEVDANAVVLAGHEVTLTADADIGYLSVAAGGILNIGTHTLSLNGSGIENQGTVNCGTGTVDYAANYAQCVVPLDYYNLRISGIGTKRLCGDIRVANDLEILGFPASLFLDADVSGNYTVEVGGDWLTRGTFIPREGAVIFNGSGVQKIYRDDGAVERFYNLEVSPGVSLDVNHDIVTGGTLTMNGGNINLYDHLLTIGLNGTQRGSMVRSSGTVVGMVRRWINAATDDNTAIEFPVGTSTYYRPIILNFANITNSGTLTATFTTNDPGANGLPLEENGVTIDHVFSEGYWPVTRENGFLFSGNYNVDLVAEGFSSSTLDSTSRVLARTGSGNAWVLLGDHVNAADSLVQRDNVSGNLYQFGISAGAACEVIIQNCPTDISVNTDLSNCTAAVTWTEPTVAGTCSGITLTSNYHPGDHFPPGITVVRYIASDIYTNGDTCEFTITVADTEVPVFSSCPADINIVASDEYCGNIATWVVPSATDNCGVTITSSHASGDFFNVGTTLVTYTAQDPSGNTATCSFNVNVAPAAAPVITGDAEVCTPVTATYSTPALAGKTYLWNVTGGSISGSNTGTEVDVAWTGPDPGTVELVVTSGSGCSVTNSINIDKQTTPVIGDIQSGSSLTRR